MAKLSSGGGRLGVRIVRNARLYALLSMLSILAFAVLLDPIWSSHVYHPSVASADPEPNSVDSHVELECPVSPVIEGDDFAAVVHLDGPIPRYPGFLTEFPFMRGHWFTYPITADETDFEPLEAVLQVNSARLPIAKTMERTLHTQEDVYPEATERYGVRFAHIAWEPLIADCVVSIVDDDGVGIHALEITSQSPDTAAAYGVGDTIEITAHFTGTVTNTNPQTGATADYAGLHLQVGENRRVAKMLRGDGTDTVVFGYTVQADDLDQDGVSVESGGPGTGMTYNPQNRDGGLWSSETTSGRINRIFHGLDDDPGHIVKPTDQDIDEPTPTPTNFPYADRAVHLNLLIATHGELTDEDGGKDWYSFDAAVGKSYIIEATNRMHLAFNGPDSTILDPQFVDHHLVDPSILELVNEANVKLLGEYDRGGFIGNFARAFFRPDESGTYYFAIGAGGQDRTAKGHYTISVRADDHADDHRTEPGVVLQPNHSVTAAIESDVAPDDPDLQTWAWLSHSSTVGSSGNTLIPAWGLASLDDRDVFKYEIATEGCYRIEVSDGPAGVGIWNIRSSDSHVTDAVTSAPQRGVVWHHVPGTYYAEVGTPHTSVGNIGTYTVSLVPVTDTADGDDDGAACSAE